MSKSEPRLVSESELRDFAARLFMARGMGVEDARTVADVLVWADLRGGETHGVSRIPHYFTMIDKGVLQIAARPRVQTDFGGLFVLDADGAAGAVAMRAGLQEAQRRARAHGVGMGLISRATHAGAMGCYAEEAATNGFVAIVFAAGPPLMAYHGARVPSLSTAPVAIAVPGGPEGVLLLDMASSQISNGRLKAARRSGRVLPQGAALDAQGRETTDPAEAEVLTPMGGPKGAGLALMIECVTSLLAGAPILTRALESGGKAHGQNASIILIDIARVRPPTAFAQDVEALAEAILGLPRADGSEALRLPGERGARLAAERRIGGVPVDAKVWVELVEIAERLGVSTPAADD